MWCFSGCRYSLFLFFILRGDYVFTKCLILISACKFWFLLLHHWRYSKCRLLHAECWCSSMLFLSFFFFFSCWVKEIWLLAKPAFTQHFSFILKVVTCPMHLNSWVGVKISAFFNGEIHHFFPLPFFFLHNVFTSGLLSECGVSGGTVVLLSFLKLGRQYTKHTCVCPIHFSSCMCAEMRAFLWWNLPSFFLHYLFVGAKCQLHFECCSRGTFFFLVQ